MKTSEISNLRKFWEDGGNWYAWIPDFQRPYSWKEDMVEQLLNDIININSEDNEGINLFCGSLYILVENDKGFIKKIIVDGQQRLLTVFLILLVVRDKWKKEFNKLGIKLVNPKNNDEKVKFDTEVVNDKDILNNLIYCWEVNDNQKKSRVYKNYLAIKKWFSGKINSSNDEETSHFFEQFFDNLSKCEILINILDESKNDVFQVFESINAKTLPLDIEDILKNYFASFKKDLAISKTYNEAYKQYRCLCDQIKKNIPFRKMLRYFFQYTEQQDISFNNLLIYFFSKYNKNKTGENNHIKFFVSNFKEFIDFSYDILTKDKLKLFFKEKTLILGQLFWCKKEFPDYYEFIKKILISWLVRRNICDMDSSGITKQIPLFIKTIYDINPDFRIGCKQYFDAKKGKEAEFPGNDKVCENIVNNQMYFKKNICLPLLLLIEEEFYNSSNISQFDLKKISIDHVHPQNSKVALLNHDKGDVNLVDTIGNLTLLPKRSNAGASNKPYEIKQKYLTSQRTVYQMNTYFENHEHWEAKDIKARSEFFANGIVSWLPYYDDDRFSK